MACFNDFDGVYFSVQSLRLFHAEVLNEIEIIVVDNCPQSSHGQSVRDLITHSVLNGLYFTLENTSGTAMSRDVVFREAQGENVLCIDCHVMIAPGAVARLIQFYASHPECRDLIHGPMLYDDYRTMATHMDPEWRCEMYGVWGFDERGAHPDAEPFEIPMHGCGLFSCRKDAWPGFHPEFREFGGEEGYIHDKFRQSGCKTICLPFLRWVHRFGRPGGVPYRLTRAGKVRNYLLARQELGQPIDDVLDHFGPLMKRNELDSILHDVGLPPLLKHLILSNPSSRIPTEYSF